MHMRNRQAALVTPPSQVMADAIIPLLGGLLRLLTTVVGLGLIVQRRLSMVESTAGVSRAR